MLDTSHAHGPILREWLRTTLFLKPKSIQNRPRASEEPFRIQNGQVNDALPTATWNRGAAEMLNLQPWFDIQDDTTKQARNLRGFWVVRAKLGRR